MKNKLRILIISNNPFSSYTNNGKTLESLFSWVPQSDLFQLYFHNSQEPDFFFCKNYFKVTDLEVIKTICNFKSCGNKVCNDSTKNVSNWTETNKIVKKNRSSLLIFRDILWKIGYNKFKRKNLYEWFETISPDLIFFVAGNCGFAHEISLDLSKRYNVPLYTYFTDDYIIYPQYTNLLEVLQKFRLKGIYEKTIKRSVSCFSIGEEMSKVYSLKYNKNFIPIMNSVNLSSIPPKTIKSPIIISFFGNLELNRWKMIARFANKLKLVEKLFNMDVLVKVYSMSILDDEMVSTFKQSNIEFCGFVSGDSFKEALKNSNILLHVESDDKVYSSLTRLSVSTKIPEYLVSNRPIIAYGPSDVASISLLQKNKIGYVIDCKEEDSVITDLLKKYINEIITGNNYICKRAYNFVAQNYDKNKIQECLKNILYECF